MSRFCGPQVENQNKTFERVYTIIYQVNTENLYPGLTVNNYKEMCKLLRDEEKTSNSKKAQIAEWNRYFRFRREGHKYIIEEVYNLPLFKQVRKGSITAGFIEELICSDAMNSMQKRGVCSFSEEYQIVNLDYQKFIANGSDKEKISAAKQRVVDEMKVDSIESVFKTGRSKEFYDRLKNKLNTLYGWRNAYKVFHITFVTSPSLMDNGVRMALMQKLNNQVIDAFHEHFQKMIQYAQAEAKKEQYAAEGNFWGVKGLMGKYSYRLTPSQYGLSYEQEIKNLIEKYIQIKTDISHI